MLYINPLDNKYSIENWLKKLVERDELENLVEIIIKYVLKQKILAYPSIGPHGEQGKDFVTEINNETKEYCSYLLKQGNLSNHNLKGSYGLLQQLEDALSIPLENKNYFNSKRTAIIVHNGTDGNRTYLAKYENHKALLENTFQMILSRPIERWDLNKLTDLVFENRKKIQQACDTRDYFENLASFHKLAFEIIDFVKENKDEFRNNKELATKFDQFDKILEQENRKGSITYIQEIMSDE